MSALAVSIATALAAIVYAVGVARMRRRWPLWRTATFFLGLAALLAALAAPFFDRVEVVSEPAAALARGRELATEGRSLLVTGSLYLLADLASVRPSCLPWQASASG